jgi:lambda repressor-like predicted transcriptional regulator
MKQYAKDVEDAKKATEQLKQATDSFLKSFSTEFLQNSGLGSFETFFDGTFNKLLEGATTVEEKFAVTFNTIAESAQEAFNFISNASQANFDNEYARLEGQKETALLFAGDSASARVKIEDDLKKKKEEIANRENKAKQKQAIFNIAIDTAQGIVSALASTPPNIPLSIAIGAIGAIQLGLVASQKVPQYFEGTDNHTGGLMLVNDGKGANYQEKIILPNGKEIMPQGRNVLMDAPSGTKVLTHEQQIMQMLNERGISMNANYAKNNGMTAQEMDGILSKHFSKIQTNVTTFDENGVRSWSEKNGNRTISTNNRVSRTGYSV